MLHRLPPLLVLLLTRPWLGLLCLWPTSLCSICRLSRAQLLLLAQCMTMTMRCCWCWRRLASQALGLVSRHSTPFYSLIAVAHSTCDTAHTSVPYLYDGCNHRMLVCGGDTGDVLHCFACDELWDTRRYRPFWMEVSLVTGWLYVAMNERRKQSERCDLGGQIVVIR